ncbi:Reverse transcriptase zinc-binding domain [Macleaya cordata]|uniref:Reverse transcriptase zinc-binding domain n=1 Tax=Macleaya cordata TaxID=56857 RepID=A0A200R8F0_MACCD|nr:Reverse transcriptase zinc-binding domain [Macleaya cordata]
MGSLHESHILVTRWVLGDGKTIKFWKDRWLDEPIVNRIDPNDAVYYNLNDVTSAFIMDGTWNIPDQLKTSHPEINDEISKIIIPIVPSIEDICWESTTNGVLNSKTAYELLRSHGTATTWGNKIWHYFLPPRKSLLLWRVLNRSLPTDDRVTKTGCAMVSRCSICLSSAESIDHLFLECSTTKSVCKWLEQIFERRIVCSSYNSILNGIWSSGFGK